MISLIAAVAENRVIGDGNALPWRLPADLKHFRELTTGHPVIMGRRNFESMGRALPQRKNIVVTRQATYDAPGCMVVGSLDEAFSACREAPQIFIIGGSEIYTQTVDRADRLDLTWVHASVPGDTYFPEIDWTPWREASRIHHPPDERHRYAFSFVTYERAA